jgi:hypothetical protein
MRSHRLMCVLLKMFKKNTGTGASEELEAALRVGERNTAHLSKREEL